ncbi:MAG: [protein-PII] uridylyltransferase, partial [Pseudomonadota bacterium]
MNVEQRPVLSPTDDAELEALRLSLAKALAEVERADDLRSAATQVLAEHIKTGRAKIAAQLQDNPRETRSALEQQTALTDRVVIAATDVATTWLTPNPNPTKSEEITVLAVGGYGRAEMAPVSDVDLLFLTPYKQTAWGERVIEAVLYILWDLKLKVGQAVRTVDECLRLGQTDITIRTALLEHRFLTGAPKAADELRRRLWEELFVKTGPQFIEAKLEERADRHKRQGGSRYLLEPNVKEGKGGLRDLQTLYWIAKYLHNVSTPADLVAKGVFTQDEFEIFERAEGFLWRVRTHLHLISGRALEQLTFDM